jgi:hypothetical protein
MKNKISINVTKEDVSCYVGPCHHGMAHQVVDGGDRLQAWRVTENKQWTADKGCSYSFRVGQGAKTARCKKKKNLFHMGEMRNA